MLHIELTKTHKPVNVNLLWNQTRQSIMLPNSNGK